MSDVVIKSYDFEPLDGREAVGTSKVEQYAIKELDGLVKKHKEEMQPIIKNEKNTAIKNHFKISPVVKKFRGIKEMELQEFDRAVALEVSSRVKKIKQDAFQEGLDKGREEGRVEIIEALKQEAEEKLNQFNEMIDIVVSTKEKIIENQKNEIYGLLKSLTRWIVLRELKDDGEYIHRLLEKLVLELQTTDNLLIQVNSQYYEQMPEILELVEKRVGQLKNVRVETFLDDRDQGIIVTSENGILKGDMNSQFTNLDKLFETVNIYEKSMMNQEGSVEVEASQNKDSQIDEDLKVDRTDEGADDES